MTSPSVCTGRLPSCPCCEGSIRAPVISEREGATAPQVLLPGFPSSRNQPWGPASGLLHFYPPRVYWTTWPGAGLFHLTAGGPGPLPGQDPGLLGPGREPPSDPPRAPLCSLFPGLETRFPFSGLVPASPSAPPSGAPGPGGLL